MNTRYCRFGINYVLLSNRNIIVQNILVLNTGDRLPIHDVLAGWRQAPIECEGRADESFNMSPTSSPFLPWLVGGPCQRWRKYAFRRHIFLQNRVPKVVSMTARITNQSIGKQLNRFVFSCTGQSGFSRHFRISTLAGTGIRNDQNKYMLTTCCE